MEKLESLYITFGDNFYPLQMDVSLPENIDVALASLPVRVATDRPSSQQCWFGTRFRQGPSSGFSDWLTMINTNIVGLAYLTRQVLPQMVDRNSGMIINLGSTAGTVPYPGANVYGASKAFVKQFSLNLRADLAETKIRVTNIEPGLCEGTGFSISVLKVITKSRGSLSGGLYAIRPEDIANTVSWIASQPEHLNVNRIEIMPVSQSFGPQPVFRD